MGENILKELCNKLLSLFKQTEAKQENAKDIACNRLRVVLMQDRTNLTPELLQRMRHELVELLSKYVEMDKEALELNFDQDGDQMALMLSIPVIRAKDESEIEEALKSECEADDEDADSEIEDDDEDEDAETEAEAEAEDENTHEDEVAEEEQPNDEIEKEGKKTKKGKTSEK